jgi:hypothetical protein
MLAWRWGTPNRHRTIRPERRRVLAAEAEATVDLAEAEAPATPAREVAAAVAILASCRRRAQTHGPSREIWALATTDRGNQTTRRACRQQGFARPFGSTELEQHGARRYAVRHATAVFGAGVILVGVAGACAGSHPSGLHLAMSPAMTEGAATPASSAQEPLLPLKGDPRPSHAARQPEKEALDDAGPDDSCPMPDEVWPRNCTWRPAFPLGWYRPEPSALDPSPEPPFWRHSEASALWAGWCHQAWATDAGVRGAIWSDYEARPPPRLLIALSATGAWDYSVNVFRDGRALFKSDRCMEPVRSRQLSEAQVNTLVAACRSAGIQERKARCAHESKPSDFGALDIGFFDKNTRETIHADGDCSAGGPIAPLVQLIARTVGAGTWMN